MARVEGLLKGRFEMLVDDVDDLDRRVHTITEPKQGRRDPRGREEIEFIEFVVIVVARPLLVPLETCFLTRLAGLFLTLLLALTGNKLPSVQSSPLQVRILPMADIGPDLGPDDCANDKIALIKRVLGQVTVTSALVVLATEIAPHTIRHLPRCLLVAPKELRYGLAGWRVGVALAGVVATSATTAKVGLQGDTIRAVFLGSGVQIPGGSGHPIKIQILVIFLDAGIVGHRRRLVNRGRIAG